MDARWISFPRVGSALRGWLWIDKSIARLQARLVSEHAVLQADAIERDMVPLNYALRSTSFVPLGPRPAVEVSAFLVSPPPPPTLGGVFRIPPRLHALQAQRLPYRIHSRFRGRSSIW